MAKSKSSNAVKDDEKKVKSTNQRRKSKSERTIEAQIELENEAMLNHVNENGVNVTYKRPLRKL